MNCKKKTEEKKQGDKYREKNVNCKKITNPKKKQGEKKKEIDNCKNVFSQIMFFSRFSVLASRFSVLATI